MTDNPNWIELKPEEIKAIAEKEGCSEFQVLLIEGTRLRQLRNEVRAAKESE